MFETIGEGGWTDYLPNQ